MRDEVIGGPIGCRGLTDEGREQAGRLAQRLKHELDGQKAAVYSSVIPRAIETGESVASALGIGGVTQDCGLCTWHSPAGADGMRKDRFWVEYAQPGGGVFRPFQRGNESWAEMVARIGRSLEEIAARHAGETVIVATHGEAVNSSLIILGQLPLMTGFDTAIAATSITEWTTDGDPSDWPRPRWTLRRFNDSAHLTWDLRDRVSG
jgi:probable phosphoglycerate mutase